MTNPALWTAVAGCIGAVAALLTAIRAHTRAVDAQSIAIGHALDRSWHPGAPPQAVRITPPDAPSSPGGVR